MNEEQQALFTMFARFFNLIDTGNHPRDQTPDNWPQSLMDDYSSKSENFKRLFDVITGIATMQSPSSGTEDVENNVTANASKLHVRMNSDGEFRELFFNPKPGQSTGWVSIYRS